MAYFDNTNNANFYFTSSAPEALYAYPVLSQPSTGEGVNEPTTFAYDWSTAEQLGPTVGSATDSQVVANYGEHHVTFSSFGVLCVCLQSQRRPVRIRGRPTATLGRHTPGTIRRWLANRPNHTTPAS